MNKVFVIGAISAAVMATVDVAYADDTTVYPNDYSVHEYHPDINAHAPTPYHLRVGFGMDIGAPSAAAVGLVINPGVDWVRLQTSLTYNYLTFGGRESIQLDPLALFPHCPVGLFADVQGGFDPRGSVPGHTTDWPSAGYDYVNLYGGLRLGNPNAFHWNFEAGPTYMHVFTSNFQSLVSKTGSSTLTVGNPTVNGWLVPTVETGFTVVF